MSFAGVGITDACPFFETAGLLPKVDTIDTGMAVWCVACLPTS